MAVCVPARPIFSTLIRSLGRLFRHEAPQTTQCAPSLAQLQTSPRDSVVVLDGSPSMLYTYWPPSRLAAALEAAITYCGRLADEEPDARIAIVAYGGHARILCSLTPASNQEELSRCLRSIETIDATDIAAGVSAATQVLQNARTNQQVVILSDGQHNTDSNPRKVAKSLRTHAVIEAVGIGSRAEVDESLLKDIASEHLDGTKRYRWIGDKEQLVTHFHNLAGRIARS